MASGTLILKCITTLSLLARCVTYAFSQQAIQPDTVIGRLLTQTRLYPQENIYLHTDKSDYVAGDTVWFRAYTVNAISRKQENMSRYLYVELLDSQAGNIVSRLKVKRDSCDRICGYVPLSAALPRGAYLLRAYTRYGLNWGEEGCFGKALRIYSGQNKPVNENARPKNTYHVDFMPEGGQFVDGQPCRIAFRAQSSDGKGENIRGVLIGEQKDTLLHFTSLHNGMGLFQVTLDKKKKYYALCSNESGQVKRFTLPQTAGNASLSVMSDSAYCHVMVVRDKNVVTDSLQLVVLQRGHPRYAGWCNASTNPMNFPIQGFDEGIVHFLLLSSGGDIVSERLFFINRPGECKVNLFSDKAEYAPRQQVEVTLGLETNEGILANGDCSVTVTDINDVPADESVSIRSTLLLTADLSGNIEEPSWYFRGIEPEQEKTGLDLLMLTHGWRRYDLASVLKGNYTHPSLLPEVSMSFSGCVHTLLGKPLPNSTLRIHAQGTSLLENIQTGKDGRFVFDGFEFPDHTKYFITAQSAKGSTNVALLVDSINYLQSASQAIATFYRSTAEEKPAIIDEEKYIGKTIRQIGYSENMRHYLLDEVSTTASRIKKYETEFEQDAQITLKEERIRQSGALNVSMLMRSAAGLNLDIGTTSVSQFTLVLDGTLIETEAVAWLLYTFEVSNIQQIDVIRHSKTIGYFDGRRGTIVAITTKRGGREYNNQSVAANTAVLMPLGYQQPVERYTPNYDHSSSSFSRPDLRTTIYWKPDVTIKDGRAKVSFYTADSSSSYRIMVEGITSEGKVFKKEIHLF